MTESLFKYRAFISYSHRDKNEAQWLQSKLESYRFPKGVRFDGGETPRRIFPVFRDREELRAGPSLSESLREALSASEALIVICSPSSAASEWVDREIRFFQSLGREDRVLALVISQGVGAAPSSADSCFPKALISNSGGGTPACDVLAADLRRGADGRRLALLKLIAGLAGVSLADLVRRDQQRAIFRLRLMVGGALFLVLAFAWLGTALYLQRKEAVRQRDLARNVRDQAQELNTFFITDLRQKLRGVGRLDLLKDATQRVLAYQKSLPAELANDTAVLHARAAAMDYVGQLAMVKGSPEEAIRLLKESQAVWVALIARKDSRANGLDDYVINCKMLGEAYGAFGDVAQEMAAFQKGIGTIESLRAATPESKALKARQTADLFTSMGKALYRSGDSAAALKALDKGAASSKSAVETDSKNIRNWQQASVSFSELAEYYSQIDDLPVALEQAATAVETAETMVRMDVEHADGWRVMAHTLGVEYNVLLRQKKWPDAEAIARREIEWRQRLKRRDPADFSLEGAEANAHDNLANALNHQDKIEEALKESNQAVAMLANVVQQHPSRADWKEDLAVVFRRRGDLAFDSKVWELALADYQSSLHLRQELAEQTRSNVRLRLRLANTHLACGETLWKLNRRSEAETEFTLAQQIVQASDVPENDGEAKHLREMAAQALHDLSNAR